MSDSYIQQLFAERIGGVNYGKSTAIYKFEKIKRAKAAAKKAKPDVALIDLGVGEPDEMAFPMVVKALQTEAAKPENRGYADNGGADFKQAAARYMQNLFGVTVDADTEVLHSIGSKAALSILPGCLINPGDYVLMTVPGYPVFGTHAKYYGGLVHNLKLTAENNFLPDLKSSYPVFGTHAKYYGGLVHNLKLTAENNFLPDLKSIPADILAKAKVLVLNYPNNPTGAVATRKFFEEVVAFAKQHNLVVIQDAAYGSLHFGAEQVSILQVPGAKDVALELHSLSKSHNMTGWRIGFVAGNALLVRAYGDVKDNSDSGQFLGIQKAGGAGLDEVSIPKAPTPASSSASRRPAPPVSTKSPSRRPSPPSIPAAWTSSSASSPSSASRSASPAPVSSSTCPPRSPPPARPAR